MDKTIECPDCRDQVTPDIDGICPECNYVFKRFDYKRQGMKEEDFRGYGEIKINSKFFGKLKVAAFIFVLFFIIFKLFSS